MRAECLAAVTRAIGRQLTQVETREIEQRMARAMRTLAAKDPAAWRQLSKDDRLAAAAQSAASEIVGEAHLKQQRQALTILAHARIAQNLKDQAARGIKGLDALNRIIGFFADGKSRGTSIEYQAKAIAADSIRQMLTTLEASHPKWFGLYENKEGVEAIIKELFHENSGDPDARAGAQQFHEVAEGLRQRFNRAGGDIGKLEGWDLPHHHSQPRVAKAGRKQWKADILPMLDRRRYLNEDGSVMNTDQLSQFLDHAWETIATGGANKASPGAFRGSGARANRGNESRQIHFKDAQSYIDYQKSYGERSLYEVLVGHIEGVSKDVAMVEGMGPNPDHTYRYFRDSILADEKLADPTRVGKLDEQAIRTDALYNEVAGKRLPVASEHLAKAFDTLRSWLIAARLGSSVITSFSDDATLHLTGRVNQLPAMQLLANELHALNRLNKTEERMANRAGLALNSMLASLNRFGQGTLGASWSKKLANATLRASGLNAMTEARRRAFGTTMYGAIGAITRSARNLAALDPHDYRILLSKGISDTDFAIWQKAQLEDWGGGNKTMLTPDAIYRVSDADIDSVIASQHASIQAKAQAEIDKLNARNAQDAQWLTKRAQDFGTWLADARTKIAQRLADRGGKIDEQTSQHLQALDDRVAKLQKTLDAAEGGWMTPEGDMPGVDSSRPVSFYGKTSLRKMGRDEGRAAQAIQQLEQQASQLLREAESAKKAHRDALFAELADKGAQRLKGIDEFRRRADERAARRQAVADRIANNVAPDMSHARVRARQQAATRLLATVLEETDTAVIEPGARERTISGGQMQRGTWKGELTRSFFLFKSFPMAMIMRHWERGMSMPNTGGKAAYLATLMAATTVMGMASLQVSELLAGRDPRNMNPAAKGGTRNWIAAMLKGGSLGIYGDFLFSDATQHGGSPLATLEGPVLGEVEDMFNLTQGNIMRAAQGKKTHFGAEAVKMVKGNTPGASLWYAKSALDHLIFQRLQEYFSPGYLSSMRARARQQFNQTYWWDPGDPTPDRVPDAQAAWQN